MIGMHLFITCGMWAWAGAGHVPVPPPHILYLTSGSWLKMSNFFLSLQHFALLEDTWSESPGSETFSTEVTIN